MILNVLKLLIIFSLFGLFGFLIYRLSYVAGYNAAVYKYQEELDNTVSQFESKAISIKKTPLPVSKNEPVTLKVVSWGGPELWALVNKRRVQLGVNPLSQKDELCTIASIRLNELLELKKLDGHEGFSTLPDRRADLKWIYEKYNLSEFLLSGASSASEAVSSWENTLGHKKLLTGGEYVWGCIYAQNTFAVAITAY